MSDTPGGPEWFKAQDGKWYPPQPQTPQFANQQKKGGCLKWAGIGAGVILVLIVIAAIAGGGSSNKSTTSTTGPISQQAASSANPAVNDVSITKCELNSQFGETTAKATLSVTNHSSQTSDYYVTVAFDAPDGSQFDTGVGNVNALNAGQSSTQTAESIKTNAPSGVTCKIASVTRTATT